MNRKMEHRITQIEDHSIGQELGIEPGDILTYMAFSHTNCYLGDKKSFDSGHAYCDRQGELAPFKRWKGALAHKNDRVGFIFRIKED